jgi:PAS domain S-box-containing protein
MRSPELWLYLLATVTVLVIALRRLRQRVTPLNDQVYAKQVVIDHVHSGVAWVRFDGNLGSVNPALAKSLNVIPRDLVGSNWMTMFPVQARARLEEVYSQALLMGKASLDIEFRRRDGGLVKANLLVVSIHDHRSRFIGHYCLMEDRTYVKELEDLVQRFSAEHAAEV